MWKSAISCCFFFVGAISAPATAENIFSRIEEGPEPAPRKAYLESWSVELNMEALRAPAREIVLNVPGEPEVVVALDHWESRGGYVTLFDLDGYEHEYPDPKAKPEDFSWFWYGRGSDWTVSLTVQAGIVSGRMSSRKHRYSIEPRPGKITQLGLINSAYWTTHPAGWDASPENETGVAKKAENSGSVESSGEEWQSPIFESFDGKKRGAWDTTCASPLNLSVNSVVDVLFFYTPEVFDSYGSEPQLRAAIQSSLDDANISLRNSNIYSFRYRAIAVERVPAIPLYTYDTDLLSGALDKLNGRLSTTTSPWCNFTSQPNFAVQSRREAVQADVVALARLDLTGGAVEACGVSRVQRVVGNNACLMEPGPGWGENFPYLIFNPRCNGDRLNFAHEIGHILGMEHDPRNSYRASGASRSCPWSFGNRRAGSWVDPQYRFRSIMAYPKDDSTSGGPGPAQCASESDCPLVDAYTNWNLQWAGPSGIQPLPLLPNSATIGVQTPIVAGQPPPAHAYDTLQRLAPIVAGYKTADVLFDNGFD